MMNSYSTYKAPLIDVYYTIHSSLESMYESRFLQKITGNIVEVDESGHQIEVVGQIIANKVLLAEARKDEWQGGSIFWADDTVGEIGSWIFDCEQEIWTSPITDYYHDNLSGEAILILSHIEILPGYRGKGIGKLAIKDLYNNFIQGAALFVLKCAPVESEPSAKVNTNKPPAIMKYHGREQGYSKSFIKLHAYFKSIGFETIPLFDDEIMVMNPLVLKGSFNAIRLD